MLARAATRRRGDRHQRGARRHRPAPVRHGRRPVRPRPRRRRGPRAERRRAGPARRRRRAPARRGPHGDAVPPRHPHGHRARLRRRLAGAARALRPPAAGRRAGAGDRLAERRLPGVPLLVGSLGAGSTTRAPASAARAGRPGHAARATACAAPASAAALRAIADGGRDGFYGGAFGDGLLRPGPRAGSPPTTWRRRRPSGSTPLRADGVGHELWTIPPNSQGYLLLGAARARRRGSTCPTIPTTRSGPTC